MPSDTSGTGRNTRQGACGGAVALVRASPFTYASIIINNNRRLVTLAEHTSDHGRQTNSSTEEKGEQV